jgi:hypothetical protein
MNIKHHVECALRKTCTQWTELYTVSYVYNKQLQVADNNWSCVSFRRHATADSVECARACVGSQFIDDLKENPSAEAKLQ